ncbi:MAG: hypothetical protein PHU33_14510 [Bacteroidales bacterium]|nr:hypothetical protein [Bacteroidales bacterium]
MRNRYIFILGILIQLSITNCNRRTESHIIGDWTIYEFNASFNIYTPGLAFNKDYTCELPLSDGAELHNNYLQGRWEIVNEKGIKCIRIISENKKFCHLYRVEEIETIQDPNTLGYFKKLHLVSDSIQIICYRVL